MRISVEVEAMDRIGAALLLRYFAEVMETGCDVVVMIAGTGDAEGTLEVKETSTLPLKSNLPDRR